MDHKIFGPHFNLLATKYTSFSVCHPLCDNGAMLNMVRHAINPSLSTVSATSTMMLPLNWKGLSANAYMQILREHLEHCTI